MKHAQLTPQQKKRFSLVALAAAILLIAGFCWYVGRPMLRFVREPEQFRLWVRAHGLWGKLAYVAMCYVQVLIAFIPGEPLELSGGYAFGAWEGGLLCLLGLFLGSVTVFAAVRRFGQPLAELFFSAEKLRSLRFLQHSPRRKFLFWLIFITPGTPKDLLCYYAGLTDISWPVWLLMCSAGRLPSVLTSIIGGDALGMANYQLAILTFAVMLVISLAGLLLYRLICRRQESDTFQA